MARPRAGSQLWKSLGVLAQGYSIKAKPIKISSKLVEGQRVLKRSFLPEHSGHLKQNLPVILPNTSGTIINCVAKADLTVVGSGCGELRPILNIRRNQNRIWPLP